jgi:YesN/AraC family two-component response regulator
LNLLVIDDETVIREGIERTLRRQFPEYAVYLASHAEEALEFMRKHSIQIALTDILMPEMTGLELMKISRSRWPEIKWVVISAYSEFAYAQEAVRLGAKDYLLKPIGKEAIVEMIAKLSREIEQERRKHCLACDGLKITDYAAGGGQAIEQALEHIHAHYREELTLEKVASIVYLHPVYFSQLFKQKTGIGFKEYIIQLRLEHAKKLLQHSELRLADVAEQIGYQDMRHFTQVFRKKFHMTPTQYRQVVWSGGGNGT